MKDTQIRKEETHFFFFFGLCVYITKRDGQIIEVAKLLDKKKPAVGLNFLKVFRWRVSVMHLKPTCGKKWDEADWSEGERRAQYLSKEGPQTTS